MLKKYYTCMHSAERLNNGEPTPIIRLSDADMFVAETCYDFEYYDDLGRRIQPPRLRYITGEAATRLHEYEQLGYSPLELKNMIQKFETQKKVLNSLYGKPEYLKANLSKIASAIADSVMKDDRQVTIMFDDSGKPVISICPYSEEEAK